VDIGIFGRLDDEELKKTKTREPFPENKHMDKSKNTACPEDKLSWQYLPRSKNFLQPLT
jgi:hypothetical protein